jgi:hypothetical protein
VTIKELSKKLTEYDIEVVKVRGADVYSCTNFPDKLQAPVRDLIDCYFDIIESDWFGVKFVEKY